MTTTDRIATFVILEKAEQDTRAEASRTKAVHIEASSAHIYAVDDLLHATTRAATARAIHRLAHAQLHDFMKANQI